MVDRVPKPSARIPRLPDPVECGNFQVYSYDFVAAYDEKARPIKQRVDLIRRGVRLPDLVSWVCRGVFSRDGRPLMAQDVKLAAELRARTELLDPYQTTVNTIGIWVRLEDLEKVAGVGAIRVLFERQVCRQEIAVWVDRQGRIW